MDKGTFPPPPTQPNQGPSKQPTPPRIVACHSCSGIAFHSLQRRVEGKGPLCVGLRREMVGLSVEAIREMHAQTTNDFDKFIAVGYSASSTSMDKKGYHPVCISGTQFKLTAMAEDSAEETAAQTPAPQSGGVLSPGGGAASLSPLSSLVLLGARRQLDAMRKNWTAISKNFPHKFYMSSTRLSKSCLKTSARIVREVSRFWRDIWR